MNSHDDNWDEQRLAALFAAADSHACPPDEEFLDRLREQSTEVFAAQSSRQKQIPPRRSRMFLLATRTLAASAAAAVVAATCFWFGASGDDSALAFGKVLEKVAQADTVHLAITRQGKSTEAWTQRPDRFRVNNPDGTYKIAHSGRLWSIDEAANRATSEALSDRNAQCKGLDLLALVDLPEQADRKSLLSSRPVERVRRGGLDCDLYRMEVPGTKGKLRIEAVVDAGTQLLKSLETIADRENRPGPMAKVEVLAVDRAVDEKLFIVGDTLTEDGRVGKVTDSQGIVSVKPVMHRRWTPVSTYMLLKPGDWLRTDNRGANAVQFRLVKRTDVTLGPASLVEVVRPNRLKVFSGELKVAAEAGAPIEVIGPTSPNAPEQKITVKGTQIYRVQDEKLVAVKQTPLWLAGFEGSTNNESIGSLIANVEGRNVPLTVGYHKVSVDVRDQIARTVIEESFVNHTKRTLEGVFYFPLPQDASISGFGMWINNELVEADVVEKQRAREIYETILRERRDPGLLEWSGGNIFKARVFPIFGRSEKRIKITYTQVLPLKGNRYRYSYSLQSEMLKQHPLRELAIDVKINSAMPLAGVSSPTHTVRTDQTPHSAHVEFTAQEYTPTRDFEVVIEVDGEGSDVVLIPHRRGDDGYFMMQLMPPAGPGDWQREIVPDTEPIELLILADTSASIDEGGRTNQAELVASLLGSLTPEDKFNLAGCDVECDWIFKKAAPANEKNIETARQFLDQRISLGWTNLDGAFASALKQCGPNTHVVYVGDGIVTGADVDPVAFGKRLRRLAEGRQGTFHAVTVSSSFEPVVLKTIASLAGGSFRQISGEHGPQAVALELLGEIAKPTIRDLEVEFRGLRTARLYPEELPNLSAGTQQILLGRYLPEGQDQTGDVIVTGMRGGQPVTFRARVSLPNNDAGNSFIPRLWARMHLDALLQQGASQTIKDEIIALSEEYHIMTPYTSLLVLESDEDRERFKVKRRFQMRDGEKFFAEGRDNVDYELVQQQMKRAGDWRLGLRRSVLAQLVAMGRDPGALQSQQQQRLYGSRLGGVALNAPADFGGFGSGGSWNFRPFPEPGARSKSGGRDWFFGGSEGLGMELEGRSYFAGERDKEELSAQAIDFEAGGDEAGLEVEEDFKDFEKLVRAESAASAASPQPAFDALADHDRITRSRYAGLESAFARRPASQASLKLRLSAETFGYSGPRGFRAAPSPGQYIQWLSTLFPQPPATPAERKPVEAKQPWPREAQQLAESLLRIDQLARLKGGLRIERLTEGFEPRWGEKTSDSQRLALVSPKAWLTRSHTDGSQTIVHWCDSKQRGVFSEAFQLGRVRASAPRDLSLPPLGLQGYTLQSIYRTHHTYAAELKPQDEGQTLLVLKHPSTEGDEIHLLVDTDRHVVLRVENRQDGQATSATAYGDFVEVAGAWWATRIEHTDKDGRRTSLRVLKFTELAADAFDHQMQDRLAGLDRVQLLHMPMATVNDAKQAIKDGKATFDHQMVMLLHFAQIQQWTRVMEHLDRAEQLADGKPGMRWVRDAILNVSRRREELKGRMMQEAARLAKPQEAGSEAYSLAEHLRGQASGFMQANEMLALLETLQDVYRRQPKHVYAMKHWRQQRVNYLRNTGQADEALALQEQLARQYPHDYGMQQQYAQALSNTGDHDAAYAWLRRVLTDEAKWHDYEEQSLRSTYAQLLRNAGRYPELVDFLAEWIERNPRNTSAYQQYLTALIKSGRDDKANELVAQWLEEARQPDTLKPEVSVRLSAAVSQALGQGYNLYTNRLDERWLEPLAETALFFARHKSQAGTADQIMNHYRFRQTDQCRRVRKWAVGVLTREIDTLKPDQVQRLVNWIWPNDPAVETNAYSRIAKVLKRRWSEQSDPQIQHQLAQPLVRILSGRLDADQYLAFLRLQWQQGPEDYRTVYANQLFNALLGQPWSAELEDEAFGLLEELSNAEDPDQKLAEQLAALHRLTDRMVKARYDARMAKIEHQEDLTRTELREKKLENLKAARRGFSDRLRQAMQKRSGAIVAWLNVERLYLDVLTKHNLDRVAEECWEFLGPKPPQPVAEPKLADLIEEALRTRHLLTLANLSVRKEAPPALADRLLGYADSALQAAPKAFGWKLFKHQLLIALDRPKPLEASLRQWVEADRPDSHWRLSLGYLLAEQGKIAEAIKHFEAVQTADELGPTEYRTLADWYMVVDRRDDHEQALITVFQMMEEHRLSNWLYQKLRPWQQRQGELPSELDKDVLRVFAALFRKSGYPHNYLSRLRDFYRASRDFRLMTSLADGVVGHTAGRVYPFLKGMETVLSEVRDEATADSIVEHLATVRQRAQTDVDHRALDLLEALVERRSAEVLNQPGPHVDQALAAMRRAFKREWTSGEPRLMADLLDGLGTISQQKLADEQLRELEILHAQAAKGSVDRLHIAHHFARARWRYSQQVEAIDLLQAALDEYLAGTGDVLPSHSQNVLDTFVSYLEQHGHHARGERVVFQRLEHPANVQQTYWLTRRLYQLYQHAIANGGDVSLGSGAELYEAVHRDLLGALDSGDESHRYQLVTRLTSIYRTAHQNKYPGVADDLRAFSFQRLPELITRHVNNHQSICRNVASALHDLAGARDAVAFLIERMEQEPVWFRYTYNDGWNRHGSSLGRWRCEAGALGDLEPRLLKVVTDQLRRDLESRQARNRLMYTCNHSYYWKEKEADFRQTAEEVYAERKQSGAAVKYIAEYLYHGLHHYDRAIEILLIAHKAELLDESGQARLVQFLHWQKRFGESIGILQPMIEWRPDNIKYRTQLMHAYFQTNRPAELLALLKQTDEHFHQNGRWTEQAMAALAYSCLENELFQQSVDYYQELIPLHQRTQPRRGIGNGTLSGYYGHMGRAYAGLKDTAGAVDAACGAIISWGPRHENRASALASLHQVLRDAPDLDAFVAQLDKQSAETGLHNPIVRKAIGQVYLKQNRFPEAIAQLKLACEVQPNDTETHQALVECFDKQQDKQGAMRQVLASLQLSRRDIALYQDLGRRFGELERPVDRERAYTSIVEMLPNESESHAALAEIRQKQDLWDDAIAHWKQVAAIRALEPTGLLKLAAAQIHQQQWDEALQTLRKLDTKGWPERFGDVHAKVRELERQVEQGRDK